MSTTTRRPTPETDAMFTAFNLREPNAIDPADFARKLERERDEALAKLSTVYRWIERNHPDGFIDSQSHLQNLDRVADVWHDKLEAMREAIKEAHEALADLAERWEETPEWHNMAEHNSAWCGKIFTNVRQCKKSHAALAKLQPFLKPMNLTDEEIRIKVAEAMGWKHVEVYEWVNGVRTPKQWADFDVLPNYPKDLNACAEFEATLTYHDTMRMHHNITKILRQMKDPRPAWRAPAKVRCLAYLKTKGLIP